MGDEVYEAVKALLKFIDDHENAGDSWEWDEEYGNTCPWFNTSQFCALEDEVKRLLGIQADSK